MAATICDEDSNIYKNKKIFVQRTSQIPLDISQKSHLWEILLCWPYQMDVDDEMDRLQSC